MLTGEKLGRYKIGRMIGAGGMGEVYIAKDEQLDRDVALKVLLPEFCSQADRVQRFKYEAKVVSALNHPNIITIHEIAEIDGKLFIATELINGQTLRERIEARDLEVYEAVKIAEQVADALAIAHESNIVHRDVKPENIMVRKDGYAKILDFGLAKPIFETHSREGNSTEKLVKTQPGLVMGSVRYMSPEQARGNETDGRTDVWSLGVVLYEMLTGENPFDGETISDSLAAVIHTEPKPLQDVPPDLGWIIEKALNKDPDQRYQSVQDLALDLHDVRMEIDRSSFDHRKNNLEHTKTLLKQDTSENKTLIHRTISTDNTTGQDILEKNKTQVAVANTKAGRYPQKVFAGVGLLAVVLVAGWFFLPQILGETTVPFQSIQVSRFTDTGNASRAAVSPDGKMVAFVENKENQGKLLLRQISTGGTVEIVPFTDKGFYKPTFTPDGEYIYYVLYKNGVGTLYKIPTLGGKSTEIIKDIDSSVTFSPDGEKFAFIRHNPREGGSEIIIAAKDGSDSSKFVSTEEIGFLRLKSSVWSSDGTKLLISGYAKSETQYKRVKVVTAEIAGKKIEEPFWLKEINDQVWWSADDFVWLKSNTGVVFIGNAENNETRQVHHLSFSDGKLSRVTNDISNYESLGLSDDAKTLVANKVDVFTKLVTYTPKTNETKDILGEDKKYAFWQGFSQKADGEIIFPKHIDGGLSVFKTNANGDDEELLLANLKYNFNPVVTPDNKSILYRGTEKGQSQIWRANIDGSNPVQLTKNDLGLVSEISSSPDSKYVYFTRQKQEGGKTDIMRIPIDGGEVTQVLPDLELSLNGWKFSPAGDMVSYRTYNFDQAAQKFDAKIVFAKFDGEAVGEKINEYEIPIDAIYQWSPDGKNLTFIRREGSDNLWNLNINDGKLTQITNQKSEFIPYFQWSPKGDKVLIVQGKVINDLILIKSENGE
jgi:serine/threonine protein kinase/Tol biopolymer transport system component